MQVSVGALTPQSEALFPPSPDTAPVLRWHESARHTTLRVMTKLRPSRPQPLLFLELNEVNFDFLRGYADAGRLPTFKALLDRHGFALTTSESRYEELEPWIQWVTAHTGKPYGDHGVFRLGDIVNHDIPQIWEQLEQRGLRVGALSPMNAKNRMRNAAFFVPDPWTATDVTAPRTLQALYAAIAQAVNDNSRSRVTLRSLADLLRGFAAYAAPGNYARYVALAAGSMRSPWRKAMFLDLLLADVFLAEVRRTRPDFATLFVNAAAHIQHHYLFCSSVYAGHSRNPEWYVRSGSDPVFEVYSMYDSIVAGLMRRFPAARLMLGTGLHQVPHESVTFYWRLRDHAQFLRDIGVTFARVEPRMSRDFLVCFESEAAARAGQGVLESARAVDGGPLFEVDNRGSDAFVMLTYPRDIGERDGFRVGDRGFESLRNRVSFVALKNGEHDGVGYFIDTGRHLRPQDPPIPLASMPELINEALFGPVAPSRA